MILISLESALLERDTRKLRRESIVQFIYRKLSSISVRGNQTIVSTIPVSQKCQFKMVTRTVKPEVTVAFMIVGCPDYMLSTGKTDEMFGEKISNDRKFCK